MRLGVLDALGTALAAATETGTDFAAALAGGLRVSEPILPYPSARATHGYIEAVYMLREETGLHDDEVVSMVCAGSPLMMDAIGTPAAQTTAEAKTSLPWCVAAALVRNRMDRSAFAPEALRDPRVQAVARKVSCVADPALSEDESRVTVNRVRGKPVECLVTVNLGSENNEMTPDQVRDKFRGDMAFAGLGDRVESAIAAVERMKSPVDTDELLALFRKT